jgi:hypothetical protein
MQSPKDGPTDAMQTIRTDGAVTPISLSEQC